MGWVIGGLLSVVFLYGGSSYNADYMALDDHIMLITTVIVLNFPTVFVGVSFGGRVTLSSLSQFDDT